MKQRVVTQYAFQLWVPNGTFQGWSGFTIRRIR